MRSEQWRPGVQAKYSNSRFYSSAGGPWTDYGQTGKEEIWHSPSTALDSNGKIHRVLGASDAAGNLVPTIYITDHFGEIFAAFQNPNPAALPSAAEIIRWLEFINQQCEECSPPEWPE